MYARLLVFCALALLVAPMAALGRAVVDEAPDHEARALKGVSGMTPSNRSVVRLGVCSLPACPTLW